MNSFYKILILMVIALSPAVMRAQTVAENDETAGETADASSDVATSAGASLDLAADEAYMRGTKQDYLEAIRLYNEAIAKDGSSAAIYYNLGNAYFRVDSLAKAIINYERALRLDPTDEDTRANLEFVNSKIIDVQAADPMSNVLVDHSMRMFSANGWAVVSIVIFVVVLLFAAGYIFCSNVRLRKIFFFVGLALLIVNVLAVIVTVNAASAANDRTEAIVIVNATQLSTSPATPLNESQKAMLLHEGSKVKVIRELSTPNDPCVKKWIEVEAAGDNRAWIDAEAIEII